MNSLYLPKESYIAEDIDAKGRHILQFALPRLEETADVSFIDVPKANCSLMLDRSHKVDVDGDVRLYPGDLLDIHYKDGYESCDLPFESVYEQTRAFSASKFDSAFKAIERQSKDTEEVCIPRDRITAAGDDFYTATATYKGKSYDFVVSRLDCERLSDGSLLFTIGRRTPLNGLATKDIEKIFRPVRDMEK